MPKPKYDYSTWLALFSEIQYAHEAQYKPTIGSGLGQCEYITFYKLTIFDNGEMKYKGNYSTYDPSLWPKVKLLYKLFEEGGIVDVLYGNKKV